MKTLPRVAWIVAALEEARVLGLGTPDREPIPRMDGAAGGGWPRGQMSHPLACGPPGGSPVSNAQLELLGRALFDIPCVRFSWVKLMCFGLSSGISSRQMPAHETPFGRAIVTGVIEGIVRDWYASAARARGDELVQVAKTMISRVHSHARPGTEEVLVERVSRALPSLCQIRHELDLPLSLSEEEFGAVVEWAAKGVSHTAEYRVPSTACVVERSRYEVDFAELIIAAVEQREPKLSR